MFFNRNEESFVANFNHRKFFVPLETTRANFSFLLCSISDEKSLLNRIDTEAEA